MKKGWGEVGKERSGDGKFLQIGDGETVQIRLLDDEPVTVHTHQVSYKKGEGDEVFRSIPQTEKPDDDYIDSITNRFPAQPRHVMRCVVIEDGEPTEIKVLSGGPQIFKTLKKLADEYGDIRQLEVTISREGEKKETKYEVQSVPDKKTSELDLDEWTAKLDGDWEYKDLFPSVTPEEQKKIIEQAGIDLTYDPVAEIAADMDVDDALKTRITFGKYGPDNFPKGMTIRDIIAVDSGYLMFMADKAMSSDLHNNSMAAIRVAVENMDQISSGGKKAAIGKGGKAEKPASGTKPKKPTPDVEEEEDDEPAPPKKGKPAPEVEEEEDDDTPPPPKKGKTLSRPKDDDDEKDDDEPPAPPKKPAKAGKKVADDDFDREDIIEQNKKLLAEIPKYKSAVKIVEVIRKYSGGKTKMKDMTDEQLEKLFDHLTGEAEE